MSPEPKIGAETALPSQFRHVPEGLVRGVARSILRSSPANHRTWAVAVRNSG